jgi:hypothetical protein
VQICTRGEDDRLCNGQNEDGKTKAMLDFIGYRPNCRTFMMMMMMMMMTTAAAMIMTKYIIVYSRIFEDDRPFCLSTASLERNLK